MDHEIPVLRGHLGTQPWPQGFDGSHRIPGFSESAPTGKISPMRRMEGRDQGLALESRWKNQRIWDFPSSVFSGRFKGNFWRGFSKNPSRPLVLKRFMGKKSGDGTCIWILNHGLREGRLIQREPGNAPPKHSPGSQIFRGK